MRQHFHFIGIGGMGVGTLASLMLAKGHQISGSDLKENSLTAQLQEGGAKIYLGHETGNVDHPDCVVYSSAIDLQNPEILEAKKKMIPLQKRAELLARLLNEETGITIAGAHGKTTTSAMLANLLLKAGLHPTAVIGGVIESGGYHSHLGDGKYFVAELDESDGSFLFFNPFYSVITNIDFEHLDYYHNWENILNAYRQFIRRTKPGGRVFAWGEDERLRKILSEENVVFSTYGFGTDNAVRAEKIILNGYATVFDCFSREKKLGVIELSIAGRHNILNALACVGVGLELGIDFEVIRESLKGYQGVQRRFQLKAEVGDILVIDDYGHHPTEIAATLKAAQSFKTKRIVTVFQPHRYSRTKYLLDEFAESLLLSDYLILTDIYAASEKPLAGVNTKELHSKIKKISRKPAVYIKKDEISDWLFKIVRPGDLILFLGAGDISRIAECFSRELKEKFSAADNKKTLQD